MKTQRLIDFVILYYQLIGFSIAEESALEDPKILSLTSDANIRNRYATTLITCKMKNPNKIPKEAVMSIIIPNKAFISNFVMEINNKSYQAYVKEKEEAQKTYDMAVQDGDGAAQVKISIRNSQRFIVNINLEAMETITFLLTYEEVLERVNNQYEYVLNIHPGQVVEDLKIKLLVNETQGIAYINIPTMRRGNKANAKKFDTSASIENIDENTKLVIFNPNSVEQNNISRQMETKIDGGISGQFVVSYDIAKKSPGGLILQNSGYFAHFLTAPEGESLPKYIIFMLDTSGSMRGQKKDSLEKAMNNILSTLKKSDLFNIVEFDTEGKVWNAVNGNLQYIYGEFTNNDDVKRRKKRWFQGDNTVIPSPNPVNQTTIENAKEIFKTFTARGSTNYEYAFRVTFKLLQQNKKLIKDYQVFVMFFTDGYPTNGEVDSEKLINIISSNNTFGASIYTIAIGKFANDLLLDKMALKNKGLSALIYEGDDIDIQLKNFYDKLSTPILKNVALDYGKETQHLTRDKINTIFGGAEVIIAGKTTTELRNISLTGEKVKGQIHIEPEIQNTNADLSRLWAYLQIKQLLDDSKIVDNNTEIKQNALKLALNYSFVTELTSLVVVKPNETNIVDLEDADGDVDIIPFTKPEEPPKIESFTDNYDYMLPIHLSFALPDVNIQPVTDKSDVIIANNSDVVNSLRKLLPWIKDLLYENGTISTPSGIVELNLHSTKPESITCSLEIDTKSVNGTCSNILDCTTSEELKNLDEFLHVKCQLDERFTGICCREI